MTDAAAPRPLDTLRVVLWAGLVTGLAEGGILTFRRFVQHQSVWAPADVLWMAPLVYLAAALPIALLAAAATRALPRWCTPPRALAAAAFTGMVVVSAVAFGGALHWSAHLLLAAGIALHLGRHATLVARAARSLPWLTGLVALLAAGFLADHWLRQQRAMEMAGRAHGPNVLLIIWDTVRARSLSLHGYHRPTTPETVRRAATGVTFDAAFSTAPWTLGSHAGMFTGRYTQELDVSWRKPLATHAPTLAAVLTARGYRTAGFVANLIAASRETRLSRGFTYYEDFPLTLSTIFRSTTLGQRYDRFRPFFRGGMRLYPPRRAAEISDRFLAWEAQGSGPWFAFLNYFDAHDPYFPAPGYRETFDGPDRIVNKYDGAIALLDAELGRLLDSLSRRGVLDSTIVILTSDHGELFGEHGLHQHGNSLYTELLHVPLVIWAPGWAPRGTRVSREVSLRNLPATILDFTFPGDTHPFPGHSLAAAWEQPASAPDTLVAGVPKGVNSPPHEPVTRGNMSSLLAGGLHLILNGGGGVELYDRTTDPGELVDIAPTHAATVESLRLALARRIPDTWHADTAREVAP